MNDRLPDEIEIGYSSLRMLRLAGLGAIMTLLSASIAFNWFGYTGIDGFHVLIAYAGINFFGLANTTLLVLGVTPGIPGSVPSAGRR